MPRPQGTPRSSTFLLLLAFSLLEVPAQAATYWVGSGDGCTHGTLPDALFTSFLNAGHDFIHVATNQTYTGQAVVISNQSVTIRGGFPACEAAQTPNSSTTLDGTGGATAPVVTVSNTTGSTTLVELQDLRLTGGEEGGLVVSGAVLVQGLDLTLSGNTANSGGGLFLDGANGGAVVLDAESGVLDNAATVDGGGIACSGAGTVATSARHWSNEAGENGGAIHAENDCIVNVYPTSSMNGDLDDNDAGLDGGAVHAESGAEIHLFGTASETLAVESNRALFGRGGGIFATGVGSLVTLTNVKVELNYSEDEGGGAAVVGGARLEVGRSESCTLGDLCSWFRLNGTFATAADGPGGAIAARSGGVAIVEQTRFSQNTSDGPGRVLWAEGASSRIELEGCLVEGNLSGSGQPLVQATDSATVLVGLTTFANNLQSGIDEIFQAASGAVVGLYSSLVVEDAGVVFNATASVIDVDCVLAHEIATMPPGATRGGPATPAASLVVDPTGPDFHLHANSPAVDYCDGSIWNPTVPDLDGEARGFDATGVLDFYGTVDLGSDELGTALGLIFADGFESGDVTAW